MWRPRYDPTRPYIRAGCLCDRSPDTAERNAIELVPAHLACRVLEGASPILCGADVALQGQAAFREELRQLARLEPERQLLAGLRERREEPVGADEDARPREDIAVNVREEHQAAGRRARAPSQRGVDGSFRQVVGDA